MGNTDKSNEQFIKDLIDGIGLISETALIFYRNIIKAGATQDEAIGLTKAFIMAALAFGNDQKK